MQVQFETLDESLEEPTIPKVYRDLVNVLSPFNANSLLSHRDEDHAIRVEPGKTPPVRTTMGIDGSKKLSRVCNVCNHEYK